MSMFLMNGSLLFID